MGKDLQPAIGNLLFRQPEIGQDSGNLSCLLLEKFSALAAFHEIVSQIIHFQVFFPFFSGDHVGQCFFPKRDLGCGQTARPDHAAPIIEHRVDALFLPGGNARELAAQPLR